MLPTGAIRAGIDQGHRDDPISEHRRTSSSHAVDRYSIAGSRFYSRPLVYPKQGSATIAFTGDTLIHGTVTSAARRNGEPYDFKPMFGGVRHLISHADLAICHLEVPLSPTSSDLSSYPLFNAPREVADALAWAGYDGCSTASNHSYDRGLAGALGTQDVLADAGLKQAGMSKRISDWWEPTLYELDDLTVAHVSATYWLNGLEMPSDEEWLIQLLDVDEILAVASRARGDGADLVVVSMHCCTEYRRAPTERQLEISHRLIGSSNVDLVVTHHSHMVGPIERVDDEFIIHGLGNFLSGQLQFPALQDGVIALAQAVESGGEWHFDTIEVVPTRVARGTYRIELADASSYERTMSAINEFGAEITEFRPPGLSAEQLLLLD